jgi:hypothetical protein
MATLSGSSSNVREHGMIHVTNATIDNPAIVSAVVRTVRNAA